jgi:glutamate racemase
MIHMNDAGVSVTSVACPRLAPAIQEGAAWDGELLDMLRGYTDPLRDANVDTVILGCTHYPMVEKPLRRMLQGVEIITAGEELAHFARWEAASCRCRWATSPRSIRQESPRRPPEG